MKFPIAVITALFLVFLYVLYFYKPFHNFSSIVKNRNAQVNLDVQAYTPPKE